MFHGRKDLQSFVEKNQQSLSNVTATWEGDRWGTIGASQRLKEKVGKDVQTGI